MKQYLNLLQDILDNGVEKESGRENMPKVLGISHGFIEMDLQKGFPLLTTKKMYIEGIIHELLWFLRGDTNIKYLVDNNVNIWNGDAYRWYLKWWDNNITELEYLQVEKISSIQKFIEKIKSGEIKEYQWRVGSQGTRKYRPGDLGKIYGYQWRNQNGVDQIEELIKGLQNNPFSRYHIVNGWLKSDFEDMALPPCHLLYQFTVRPLTFDQRYNVYRKLNNGMMLNFDSVDRITKAFDELTIPKFYLDLNMFQRSCDFFLGVPFNIASMSLFLKIIAKACNMLEGVAYWTGGDVHLYLDHIPMAKEQITRKPYGLPKLNINKELKNLEDILQLTIDDFELIDYKSHPRMKAELFTGIKK